MKPTIPTYKRVGVINSGMLFLLDPKTHLLQRAVLGIAPHSTEQLLGIANAYWLDSIWIVPESTASWLAAGNDPSAFAVSGEGFDGRASYTNGKPTCMHVWHTAGNDFDRRTVSIHFPEHDPRWGWQEITKAPDLLYSVLYLRNALECEIEWGPGSVGRTLMEQRNQGARAGWIREADISMLPRRAMARALQWKGQIPDRLPDNPLWFHAYDKNSMYLGSCTSANLGEGTPELVEKPTFQALMPGLWEVEIRDSLTPYYADGTHWLWTPELEFLRRTLSAATIINRAYVWPAYHQTLRSWAEHLWKARVALKADADPASQYAYTAVKRIATQSLGWLAHEPAEGESKWYRPDWWNMIVSNARAKIMYKSWGLTQRDCGPCWINIDEMGFLSDDPNPRTAIPGMLDREQLLGGYKHSYTLPVTQELLEQLRDARHNECHDYLLDLAMKEE